MHFLNVCLLLFNTTAVQEKKQPGIRRKTKITQNVIIAKPFLTLCYLKRLNPLPARMGRGSPQRKKSQ